MNEPVGVPRTPIWIVVTVSILIVFILIAGGWLLYQNNRNSNELVQAHTDTARILQTIVAQNSGSTDRQNHIIVCVNNHIDRIVAAIDHSTPPPLVALCP